MERVTPDNSMDRLPCSIVAVACAVGGIEQLAGIPDLKADGYATLAEANRYIRRNLAVKRRIDYKRGHRPKLRDLHLDGKAVVCVYGHYLYLYGETYWSFFDNENDDVIAVWMLK